jgi:hypothetical protein
MILTDRETIFINWYLLDKEFQYTDNVRKILNLVYYLSTTKKMDLALAIHVANEKSKEFTLDGERYTKKFIWKLYTQRLAHIKHAKQRFQDLLREFRQNAYPELAPPKNYCLCGCGKEIGLDKKYVNGHNPRFKSEEEKKSHIEKMNNIKLLKKQKKIIYLKDRSS